MTTDTLGREWDAFDAYLFDIDGTLLHCTDAVHYFAFNDALSSVAGKPMSIDGVVAHGNVDLGILRDAFARADIPEKVWRPRLHEMTARMEAFVALRESEFCINVLPKVNDVLAHLRSRGAVLGTSTGNLAAIGRAKLSRAGLLHLFDFGGWSDGCETRSEVFRRATITARERTRPDAAVCAIGDTPADIRAARDNGLKVIAVATGIYSMDALEAQGPDRLLRSLEELPLRALIAERAAR